MLRKFVGIVGLRFRPVTTRGSTGSGAIGNSSGSLTTICPDRRETRETLVDSDVTEDAESLLPIKKSAALASLPEAQGHTALCPLFSSPLLVLS